MFSGWTTATVEEICEQVSVGIVIQPAQYYVSANKGVRAFRSANVGENNIIDAEWVYLSQEGHRSNSKSELRAGDVLVVRSGVPGTACVVTADYAGCNCIDIVFARPNQSKVLPHFLAEYTNSPEGRRHVLGNQGGLALKHFNVGAYKKLEILLPPLAEQRKIVEILHTWNEAIDAHERLIERKSAAFAGLALSLLTGGRRTDRTRSNWKAVTLTDVTTELTVRNNGRHGAPSVMGVNKITGMVPMKDHVRATDLSRYKIVPPGAFAYNPMRLNIGSLARNEHRRDVLVSPDYVVFSAKDGELDGRFFDHLRRTRRWSRFVEGAGSGGVRVRIYYDDFADFEVALPPIEEQRNISSILDTADREISLLRLQRDALERQKRGLMQKLLTGEWRVGEATETAATPKRAHA
jgi:type I restriction enzyme S subunit